MAQPLHKVSRRHAETISDQTLNRIIEILQNVQAGIPLNDSDSELLLLTARPIAEELLQRRAAMDLINDCSGDLSNVLFLPCTK